MPFMLHFSWWFQTKATFQESLHVYLASPHGCPASFSLLTVFFPKITPH